MKTRIAALERKAPPARPVTVQFHWLVDLGDGIMWNETASREATLEETEDAIRFKWLEDE